MAENLSGKKFGKLTVISRGENDNSGHIRWYCDCDCGTNNVLVAAGHLKSGHTKSCGCLVTRPIKDLSGCVFGKLTVIEIVGIKKHHIQWLCKCECGNETLALSSYLTSGKKKSCGCIRSVAEFDLKNFFNEKSIKYISQYCFDNCKNIKKLPFDFAVFHPITDTLMFLVELHGEQHYFPFSFNGENQTIKKENLKERQYLDEIKSNFCKKNNIPLLIIKYTNFNVAKDIVINFYNECIKNNIKFNDYIFDSQTIKNNNHIKNKRVYKRSVVQIDIYKECIINTYSSIAEAQRDTGISNSQISDCCKQKIKIAGGYAWAYNSKNLNISEIIKFAKRPNKTTAKEIYQKDLNGNIIKKWDSITNASKYMNVKHQNIQACCSGKQKTCKGFIWEYV